MERENREIAFVSKGEEEIGLRLQECARGHRVNWGIHFMYQLLDRDSITADFPSRFTVSLPLVNASE